MSGEAQGFHSFNLRTDWTKCAVAHQCDFYPNQNAYCKDVHVCTFDNNFEPKHSGNSIWPLQMTPVQLVPLLQYLYSVCQPATVNADLCFLRCHWLGFNNYFDMVIIARRHTIVTAYPAHQGICSNSQRNMQTCQGL